MLLHFDVREAVSYCFLKGLMLGFHCKIQLFQASAMAKIEQTLNCATMFLPGPDLWGYIMASKHCHPVQVTFSPRMANFPSLT